MPWVTAPPTSGPPATASPLTAKKIPSAAPRRSGGKAEPTSANASVVTAAAPGTLHRPRRDERPDAGASAQAADASGEHPIPPTNSLRRPKRSPSAAAVISSTAKLRL